MMTWRSFPGASRFLQAAVTLACLTSAACLSAPRPEAVIHQSPGLTVTLESLPDADLQATHPFTLPATTLARVLRGVQVVGDKSAVDSFFDGKLKPTPVFSEQEIGVLTPLLTTALSKAGPQQQVRFRLSHLVSPVAYQEREGAAVGSSQPAPYGPEPETTSGTLYAYGRSLYLTLDEYRQRPARPDAVNMPNRRLPDRTGLDRRRLVFTPEVARRPDIFQQSGPMGDNRHTTLVVDYQLLATLPAAVPAAKPEPAQAGEPTRPEAAPPEAATSKELQSVKDLLIKKDLEMQELKEELRSIRKQLAEQEAARQQAKPRDKKRPAAPPKGGAP